VCLGVGARVEHRLEDLVGWSLPRALGRIEGADRELLELEQIQVHRYLSFEALRIRRTSLTAAATMASRSSGSTLVPADPPGSAAPCPLPCPDSGWTTARMTSSLISTGMVISS